MMSDYYLLRLNLPAELSADMRTLYSDLVRAHNKSIDESVYFDAGFDLFCPMEINVAGGSMTKIDMGVRGAMTFIKKGSAKGSALSNPLEAEIETQLETPLETQLARPTASGIAVGYFLYPRSSTGTKTPLRLANSIGIIDAGYRGNYIAAFDNIRTESFKVERLQRLVQICPPNLTYPLRVELVEDLEQTIRGTGGFGSTGK
jgi:dUTP pyrophosphatase